MTIREKVQAWLCRHGWHSWEGLALLRADLCPACGRQWLWEASWEFVSPQDVFGAHAATEAPVRG